MRKFLHENSLGLVLLALFLVMVCGQAFAGYRADMLDQRMHGMPQSSFRDYLASAHFVEALSENWESEFLQMGAYVWLTAFLHQRGSAESKPLDESGTREGELRPHPWAPRVVHRGGLLLKLYSWSLSLAFLGLFLTSATVHAFSGCAKLNEDLRIHGMKEQTVLEYVRGPVFWFESLQNWQSEFLAVLTIVVLSVWLRQRGSPESKPVNAPHGVTGEEL